MSSTLVSGNPGSRQSQHASVRCNGNYSPVMASPDCGVQSEESLSQQTGKPQHDYTVLSSMLCLDPVVNKIKQLRVSIFDCMTIFQKPYKLNLISVLLSMLCLDRVVNKIKQLRVFNL